MPMFKVYLGNLDSKVTVETLKPLFEPFGDVDEIVIATDETGKSRGFAIILFKDPLKGQLAIETLSNKKILGRTVVINEAIKKGKKTQPATRMPRNTPLGPRAFPRVGGFGRGASGGASGRGASGGARGPGGGGRFVRNPRRLFNQPGMPPASGTPGGSAGGPEGGGSAGDLGTGSPSAGSGTGSGTGTAGAGTSAPRPVSPAPRVTPAAPSPRPTSPAPSAPATPAKPAAKPAVPPVPERPRAVKKTLPPADPPAS